MRRFATRSSLSPLPLLLLLPVFSSLALAEGRASVSVPLEAASTATWLPRILFPQARFALVAGAPAGLVGVPELSKRARYAVVQLGERKLALAFDAPEASRALGLLYGGRGARAVGTARPTGEDAFAVEFSDADCGGLLCNVRLQYVKGRCTGGVIEPAEHRRGTARIAGADDWRWVILIDADADGTYNGPRDRWIAVRKDAHLKELRTYATNLLSEPLVPFMKDGRTLMVEDVSADGLTLTLVLDKPKVSMRKVLERRYREVRAAHYLEFEREMVDFVREQKLDPRRPFAKAPAKWQPLSLSEGLALAQREGRPLLVSFFTETNAWCYRYDFYTFQDKEVDELLRRFVLVRIDAEKDPEKAYGKYARGLPALIPFTAAGKRVTFRLRGAEGDLPKQEQMITGWQRPKELAVNLRRILKAAE